MKDYFHLTLSSLLLILGLILSCSSQDNHNILTNEVEGINFDLNQTSQISADKLGEAVMKIYEDKKGNLWFGTHGSGAAKYDGNSLTYLTEKDGLCGNTVTNFAEDKDGNMWFGTHSDMCKYDGQSFTSFPRDEEGKPTLGWGWKSVRLANNGEVWVNTHQGIFKCSDNAPLASDIKFTEFNVPIGIKEKEKPSFCNTPGVVSLDLEDSNGNMWFGTDGLGVYMFDGNSYVHFTKNDGLPSNSVTAITEDIKGNIWFSCVDGLDSENKKNGGIAKYNGSEIINFLDVNAVSNTNVYTIYGDSKSNVWVVAKDLGVYRYDGKDFQLFRLPVGQKLSNDFGTQSIFEDQKGRMWFGFAGSLFRLDGESLINISKDGPWS